MIYGIHCLLAHYGACSAMVESQLRSFHADSVWCRYSSFFWPSHYYELNKNIFCTARWYKRLIDKSFRKSKRCLNVFQCSCSIVFRPNACIIINLKSLISVFMVYKLTISFFSAEKVVLVRMSNRKRILVVIVSGVLIFVLISKLCIIENSYWKHL